MSTRTSTNLSAEASPSSTPRSITGRALIPGRAARGPLAPKSITSPAAFLAAYGPRSYYNADLHDAVMAHFANGGIEAIIVRAAGTAAVRAALTLTAGGNSITVTAKEFGAWGDGIMAGYNATTKTLTVETPGAETETFTGTDLASLLAKAQFATNVDVSSTSEALPTTTVPLTALAGGDDDFENADLASLLELVPSTWGPCVVFVPGTAWSETFAGSAATVAEVLDNHCAKVRTRTAMVSSPASVDTFSEWELDKRALVAAVNNPDLITPVWPAVTARLSVGTQTITQQIDPCAVAAARRAVAHGMFGPEASPLRESLRVLPAVVDVAASVTDEQALVAFETGGVLLRKESYPDGFSCVIASWKTAAPPAGDVKGNLHGLEQRDLSLAIRYDMELDGAAVEGVTIDGEGVELGKFESRLKATAEKYASRGALFRKRNEDGTVSPAYLVDASFANNTVESLASGLMRGTARVRQSPTAEYVQIDIVAGDAGLAL